MIHCGIFDPNACQTCVDESCNKISECIICRTLRCMQTLAGSGSGPSEIHSYEQSLQRCVLASRDAPAGCSFMLRLWTGATHSHFEERPTRCLATLGSSRSVAHGEMDASSSGVMQTRARAASWNESSTLPVKLRCVRCARSIASRFMHRGIASDRIFLCTSTGEAGSRCSSGR